MNKWISVKDRLPEETCRCLVCCGDGYICDTNYSVVHKLFNVNGDKTQFAFKDVTHWMPLPDLPNAFNSVIAGSERFCFFSMSDIEALRYMMVGVNNELKRYCNSVVEGFYVESYLENIQKLIKCRAEIDDMLNRYSKEN